MQVIAAEKLLESVEVLKELVYRKVQRDSKTLKSMPTKTAPVGMVTDS